MSDIYWATPKKLQVHFLFPELPDRLWAHTPFPTMGTVSAFHRDKSTGGKAEVQPVAISRKLNLSSNPRYSHGQFHQSSKVTNSLLYIRRIIQTKWKDSRFKAHSRAKDVCCVQLASLLVFYFFVYFGISLPIIFPLLLHATLSLHWQTWVLYMFSEHRLLLTGIKSRIKVIYKETCILQNFLSHYHHHHLHH